MGGQQRLTLRQLEDQVKFLRSSLNQLQGVLANAVPTTGSSLYDDVLKKIDEKVWIRLIDGRESIGILRGGDQFHLKVDVSAETYFYNRSNILWIKFSGPRGDGCRPT